MKNTSEAEKIYQQLIIIFFNLLKSLKLKAQLKFDNNFKRNAFKILNYLLGIEIDYHITYNYTKIIAQLLVNVVSSQEKIEKPDILDLKQIKKELKMFINTIENDFKDLNFKEKINKTKFVEINASKLINSVSINEDNLLKSKKFDKTRIWTKKEPKQSNSSNSNSTFSSSSNNNQKSTFQAKTNFFNKNANFNFQNNVTPHPLVQERFYPYTSRPKWIVNYKKILSLSILILFISFFVIEKILNIFFPITLAHFYLTADHKIDYASNPGTPLKLIYPVLNSIFLIIAGVLILGYFMFDIWGKKRLKRDQFYCNPVALWVMMFFIFYLVFSMFTFIIPQILSSAIKKGNNTTKNVTAANLLKDILASTHYLIFQIVFAIFMVAFLVANGGLIFLIVKNPRLDKEKIARANAEYAKLIQAKFNHQDYEMDPSLFDDYNEN